MTNSIPELVAATAKNQSVTVDYGFATMETLAKDFMIKFQFKPGAGYVSMVRYGYPPISPEFKIIK